MTQRATLGGVLAATAMTVSTAAAALPSDDWNARRAEAFSSVCMGTAPTFVDLAQTAGRAGFHNVGEDVVLDPEVVVSRLSDGANCICFMTMGAYDFEALLLAVFGRLMSDYPNDWRPDLNGGTINQTVWNRNGVDVEVFLTLRTLEGVDWMDARVYVPGSCR